MYIAALGSLIKARPFFLAAFLHLFDQQNSLTNKNASKLLQAWTQTQLVRHVAHEFWALKERKNFGRPISSNHTHFSVYVYFGGG